MPSGSTPQTQLDAYNASFGRPAPGVAARLQHECKKIYEVDGWAGFYKRIGVAQPLDAQVSWRGGNLCASWPRFLLSCRSLFGKRSFGFRLGFHHFEIARLAFTRFGLRQIWNVVRFRHPPDFASCCSLLNFFSQFSQMLRQAIINSSNKGYHVNRMNTVCIVVVLCGHIFAWHRSLCATAQPNWASSTFYIAFVLKISLNRHNSTFRGPLHLNGALLNWKR